MSNVKDWRADQHSTGGKMAGEAETELLSKEAQAQEEEYRFPFHYIPRTNDGLFTQTCHWSWGFRYLGGLKLVTDEILQQNPNSLVDIGCGDGRFLSEAARLLPGSEVLGVDYSHRAISFARAFNPNLSFQVCDIINAPPERQFQVATLIEVLEHIEPNRVSEFLRAIRKLLLPDGRLILTVPHKNSPLILKHFQHFESIDLHALLVDQKFTVEKLIFFDSRRDLIVRIAKALLGGGGRQFVITNKFLNRLFFNLYLEKYLRVSLEKDCYRMLAVASLS